MNLSIIIPAYFEGKNILPELEAINKKVKTSYEIIVVYDLDSDSTVEAIRDYVNKTGLMNYAVIFTTAREIKENSSKT